ncbi:MAG TPA: hypothetical protein VF994_15930 [Myxococcales bacterium]
MGDNTASRNVLSFARLAACALALAAACARYSGPADPNFAKARDLYQRLYATELDEAYGDPQMDQVVSLLQSVHKRSVDAPSAQALLHAIEHGREELAKVHAEREKLRKAAAEVVSAPSNIDPARVLEEPDAGPPQDPYGPAASVAQINKDSGGCLVAGEPFHEGVTNRTGNLYRLAPNPVCKDKLPGFVGQAVMVSDGKIYRRILDSQVPHPPPSPAGAPDGGVTGRAGAARAAAPAADAGVQEYLVVPGGPLPPAEAATATARAGSADGGSGY